MTPAADPLELFSPPTRSWFAARIGQPTEVQNLAWPVIAAGEHVLVTAPTGSGKTLAAFLWAVDRLLGEAWPGGQVRVLYVSPLRALGNDIRRNLLEPLAGLRGQWSAAGLVPPAVRVLSRTGDTPQAERRAIAKSPPEILITTPESLNILLASASGRALLRGLRSVILDEVHAVIDGKRGVHLMTAVERLAALSGELQRIALSATVKPLDEVARWVGGAVVEQTADGAVFRPRRVQAVAAATPKRFELEVALPIAEPGASRDPETLWAELTAQLKRVVRRNRSTLIFGNSKRIVEKVARFLNEAEPDQLAYSHHGALSREIRSVVEDRLKAGSLRAIVATNSLELGIDIGSIDEVVLVQPPPTVASTLQRLGRSGHRVGETSRGRIYPLHSHALIVSAVLARAVLDGDIEPSRPIANPLDVLAQVLLSMTVERRWQLDELYDAVRAAEAYRQLPRAHFDLVVEMLAGRFATTRVRGLRPLVSVDRIDRTIRARPGAERLIFTSGGTIPDRGYFTLRIEGSGAPLGQLDEEFVWERAVGDSFSLGVQSWRIQRITHNDVFVAPVDSRSSMAPFWRAEERDRSHFLSDLIGRFLEQVMPRVDDPELARELERRHRLQPAAAAELCRVLAAQVAATGTLPHRHQVVVEHTAAPDRQGNPRQLVLHTMWGGCVNRPLAYALAAAWRERFSTRPEVIHGDDCVVVTYDAAAGPVDPFALVRPQRLEDLLRSTLESTGFFGARFREAAGRALLLPRAGGRRRTPLWLNRQRAKEMLEVVSGQGDFPLVLEAWRECLHDAFELEALREHLADIADGTTAVRHVTTDAPSPFADQVAWRQVNRLMYEDDRPPDRAAGGLRADLVRELAFASHLRPRIPRRLVDELESKLQRTAPGYAPRNGPELLEWAKERRAIPEGEWRSLLAAVERDHAADVSAELAAIADRLLAWQPHAGGPTLVSAAEAMPAIAAALGRPLESLPIRSAALDGAAADGAARALSQMVGAPSFEPPDTTLAELLGEWLAGFGPVEPEWIAQTFGLERSAAADALDELADAQAVLLDQISEGSVAIEACDRENLERLLRMARSAARPSFRPLPAEELPLWLAHTQGLGTRNASIDDLKSAIERLVGCPLPVDLVETEILPARIEPYHPSWLDALLAETELEWFGCGERRIAFGLAGDRNLVIEAPADDGGAGGGEADGGRLLPGELGRYTFTDLLRRSGADSGELLEALWRAAWQGEVATDSFAPLRQGVATGFEAAPVEPDRAAPPPPSQLRPLALPAAGGRQLVPAAAARPACRRPRPGRGGPRPGAPAPRPPRPAVPGAGRARAAGPPLVGGVPLAAHARAGRRGGRRPLLRGHPRPPVRDPGRPPPPRGGPARGHGVVAQRRRSGVTLQPGGDRPRHVPAAAGGVQPPRLPRPPAGADLRAARRPVDHLGRPRPPPPRRLPRGAPQPARALGRAALRDHRRGDQQPAGRGQPLPSGAPTAVPGHAHPDRAQALAALLKERVGHGRLSALLM
ncbi:MAG TPA: DEAD/DEAH box helicase [Thermoanaerobaculales bacterium]|nr:DEAD/DEAH box helicase [Thermoanaerobaculales bacterium]HQL30396.1 DEAD/DEAH box helicase [Thermoanaerobaculales bacterium]